MQHRVTRAKLSLWVSEISKPTDTEPEKNDKSEEDKETDKEENNKNNNDNHYYNYHHHHHHSHNHNHNHYHRHYHNEHREVVSITLQRVLANLVTKSEGENTDEGSQLGPPLVTKHLIGRHQGEEHGFWVTIELGRMVAEWFRHPRNNLGVVIRVNDEEANDSNSTSSGSSTRKNSLWKVETDPEAEFAPYLEIQMQEPESKRGSRVKRNVGLNCDEASQETRCCRYKLTVDFEKFGWDWIIAPKK